jgi:hypothetical protein
MDRPQSPPDASPVHQAKASDCPQVLHSASLIREYSQVA